MKQFFLKPLLLAFAITLVAPTTHADHLITCPSVKALQGYEFGVALPYAFNKNNKLVSFISVAIEPTMDDTRPYLGLVIYPVPVAFTDSPETNTKALIANLEQETESSVTYAISKGEEIPMCIYSLPGNNQVTAFLFSDDGEYYDGSEKIMQKMSQKKQSKAQQAMHFLQFVNK